MFSWSPYRSPFYFLLQAPSVNHVKCHRLIDRLCFVFFYAMRRFRVYIHVILISESGSLNHLGKGERAGRGGKAAAAAATYHCCTTAGVYSECHCWFSRCWAPESNDKSLHLVWSVSGAATALGPLPRPRPFGLTQGRIPSSEQRGDVTFLLEAQRSPGPA